MTNSHCTNIQGGIEGTIYHQPTTLSLFSIGVEIIDPPYFTSLDGVGACPAERRCRYSDTAFARYDAGISFNKGLIARPDGLGSLNISHTTPYFRIVEEFNFPIAGEFLHKVGRTTGWTQGLVSDTCVNANVSDTDITLLCQDLVNAGVGGGDSGSPVFGIVNSPAPGDARLYGILWGGNADGTLFAFSAMGNFNVQRVTELGPLDTCAPGFSPC